jgi:hypothetical protein
MMLRVWMLCGAVLIAILLVIALLALGGLD